MPTNEYELMSQSIDKLTDFFVRMPERLQPLLVKMMSKSLMLIEAEVAEYPPTTEANAPGRYKIVYRQTKTKGTVAHSEPMGYYERGKGSWRPIKQVQTLTGHIYKKGKGLSLGRGVQDAPKAQRPEVRGYVLRPTSEQLGKNWTTQVQSSEKEVIGLLGNATSYADWVQGFNQAQIPHDRDWIPIDQAIEDQMPNILALADETLDLLLKEFPSG